MRWPLMVGVAVLVTGSIDRVIAQPGDFSVKDTRRLAYNFAKCVVARHPAAASAALLTNVDNQAFKIEYGSLIDGNCLVRETHANTKMSFPGDLYRYALADALVAREFSKLPPPDLSSVPPLERAPSPDEPIAVPVSASKLESRKFEQKLKDYEEAQTFHALGVLGECVVRTDTKNSKALLVAKPETPPETASFDALRSALAQCLPEGRTLTLGKLALRGTIAVNYYRLAHAAHLAQPMTSTGVPSN